MADTSDTGASKVYTRTGDKGKTSLIGGTRVSKSHLRLDSYGTIDELNSQLGVLQLEIAADIGPRDAAEAKLLRDELERVQNDLFDVGSQLACEDEKIRASLPPLHAERIAALEREMDRFSSQLKALKNFILPGGCRSAAHAHVARTVARRAERLCVALGDSGEGEVDLALIQYVNRLSDYLFVLSRHLNRLMKIEEPIWKPLVK